jgi:outer membrane protein
VERTGTLAGGAAVALLQVIGLAMAAGACRAESLQDAWAAALAANQGLQAAQAGAASARSGVAAARAERLPTVNTVNAYTWLNNTPTFKSSFSLPGSPQPLSLSVPFLNREFFISSTLMNIPLYTGGRITSGIEAAGAQAGAAHAEEFTAAMDLKLEVTQAYLNVLRAEKILALARSNVSSLQAHERDVSNLFKEGVAKRTDLLSSQVSLARARQRVIQANNERDIARAAYNRLLGRPLTTPTTLDEMALKSDLGPGESGRPDDVRKTSGPDKLPEALPRAGASHGTEPEAIIDPDGEAEIEGLTATALSSRSELAALSHQAAAYAAQARGVESVKKPQVGVIGGFNYISDTHLAAQDYWSGTLGASWLLVDSHRSSRKAEALRLKEGQTLKQRNETASRIALAVRSSWLSLQSSRSALQVARATIAQADENLRETRERYREQVVTNTEVLDAETLRLQTYTDYYNSFYSVLQDQYRLSRAAGIL